MNLDKFIKLPPNEKKARIMKKLKKKKLSPGQEDARDRLFRMYRQDRIKELEEDLTPKRRKSLPEKAIERKKPMFLRRKERTWRVS